MFISSSSFVKQFQFIFLFFMVFVNINYLLSTYPTVWFGMTELGSAKSYSDEISQFEERFEQVEEISSALEVRQDDNDGEVCC